MYLFLKRKTIFYFISIIRNDDKIELSPAYDLLNSTIVLKGDVEEIALSISGKKKNLSSKILVDYFGKGRCGLTEKVVENILTDLIAVKKTWFSLLDACFLSKKIKEK